MASPFDDDSMAEARRAMDYEYLLPPAPASLAAKMAADDESPSPAAPDADPRRRALTGPDWPALTEQAARNRALGCLLGLAIGDAVGTAVEFRPRDSFPPLTDMIGGGPFQLAAGEWTDDTTMALCLAESLLDDGMLDLDNFMTRLLHWVEDGENSVTGRCFDIGNATRAAIAHFAATGEAVAGSLEEDTAGNGSLVRLAPVAIYASRRRRAAARMAQRQSRATHGAADCVHACELFVSQLIDALTGADKHAATRPRVMGLPPRLLLINAGEWRRKTRDQIRSTGYVVHTLEAALWSVWTTNSFEDAVLTAANLGDDADSVAAVAGQLAGALYGVTGIPRGWLEKLAWRPRITELASDLFRHRLPAPREGEEDD